VYQFTRLPFGLKRAPSYFQEVICISNDKVRITAVTAVNALGEFAPLMLIVKYSASSGLKPDQKGMLEISNLHKKPGFR
jgi:hypothetical protein